jgi:hypothetical protein
LQAQLQPRFDAKAWLPFKNVKLVYYEHFTFTFPMKIDPK